MSKTVLQQIRRSRSRSQLGVTTLELGICVSLFLVLLLAIIQYAVIMANVVALNHIARSTARFAAVHGTESTANDLDTTPNSIRAALKNFCAGSPVNYNDITNIDPSSSTPLVSDDSRPGSYLPGDLVTIRIQYNMNHLVYFQPFVAGLTYFSDTSKSYQYQVEQTQVIDVLGNTQTQ